MYRRWMKNEKERPMKKNMNVALWVLQIAVAAVFVVSALPKLAGAPMMVQMFDALGFGQWFRYFTVLLELGGAVLLLVPALAGIGALVLAIVRSEEHTSELQSQSNLVCRLLLEK